MDDLTELFENLDLENMSYFYHITGKGNGNKIIDEGLLLKEQNLLSTSIRISDFMIQNPIEYCKGEYQTLISKREEMVIIGCYQDEEESIVEPTDNWRGSEQYNYIISNKNILCYIDLETLDVIYNQEYGYGGKYV